MKISIRVQIVVVTLSLLIGTLFCCWLINDKFLEGYYEKEKQKNVQTAYEWLST